MSTTTSPLTVPVGVTRDGKPVTVDLARGPLLVAGGAGSGKSELLRRILALQGAPVLLFHADGTRPGIASVTAAGHAEMLRRQRDPVWATVPALVVVDLPTPEIGPQLRDIAVQGRGAGVHLIMATQSLVSVDDALVAQFAHRIVLGRPSVYLRRAFSEPEWEQVKAAAVGERFSGLLVDADGGLTPFTTLPTN
ncbi:FtsK/SpoIIIE domain-containing protein [Tsukamurella tyrosinosolvens]|uniref:FtsK/SpoIIIE domain-containing protein n=1 Tax=Tsukamurella tyrosinosolvens TaxID=57704 RepID=UPI003F49EF48